MNAWDDARIARGMKAQLARRRERINAGEKPLGWKVGLGAPAAMQRLSINAPLVGHLMQSAVLPSGGAASIAGWVKPVAEAETAVHMGRDLPAGGSREAAAAAIGALGPAIELADMEIPPDDVEAVLACNIYQRHVVLGAPDGSRAGGKVAGLVARVSRRGAEVARMEDVQVNTGDIIGIVRHVADTLGAYGETLRAGEIIITGSITPPLIIEPDEADVGFTLEPVGSLSIRLTR
jgi:2-keto-4-pentenoate hydratase